MKEKISSFKDIAIKIIQHETQREKGWKIREE